MPSTALTNALAGKIAGVVAVTNSGEPGSGAEFYIRGIGTFGGKATPLILLDDVEVSAADLQLCPLLKTSSRSRYSKDASATAIYGARGANGVMIVKTKGGDYNTKTNINVLFGELFQLPRQVPRIRRRRTLHGDAQHGTPLTQPEHHLPLKRTLPTRSGQNPYLYPDVDWTDDIQRDMAMRQRANVNVSGGGSKVKYYMSLDFQHEDGLLNTEKLCTPGTNNIQIYNYTFQNNISYKSHPNHHGVNEHQRSDPPETPVRTSRQTACSSTLSPPPP